MIDMCAQDARNSDSNADGEREEAEEEVSKFKRGVISASSIRVLLVLRDLIASTTAHSHNYELKDRI